jgi:hypothetical protein
VRNGDALVLCVHSSECELPFIGKGGRCSAGGKTPGAAGSLSTAGPGMCRLSPWTLLTTAPEAVVGRLLGSVSPGTPVDRCDQPYPMPCDAPTVLVPWIAFGWRLWRLSDRISGPIDPSDPSLHYLIKLAFLQGITLVQVVLEGVGVLWTRVVPQGRVSAPGKAGQTRLLGRAWHMWRVDPKFSQMCTCVWKSQYNLWNFISTKNVHETYHILLSTLRFWQSNFCCKDC